LDYLFLRLEQLLDPVDERLDASGSVGEVDRRSQENALGIQYLGQVFVQLMSLF